MMFKRKSKKQARAGRQPRGGQLRSSGYSYFSPSRDGLDGLAKTESGKKNNKKRRQALPAIALSILSILFIYETFLGDVPHLTIQSGTDPRLLQGQQAYVDYAKQLIDKNLSNRNKITIDTASIDAQLQNKFPEIKTASLSVPIFGNTPILNIVPAPIALILLEGGGHQYAVSNSGVTVAQVGANSYHGLPALKDDSNLSVSVGAHELPQSYVSFVQLLAGQLKAKGIQAKGFDLAPDGELDLHLSGEKYYVKFNLNDSSSAEQQIGDFFATQNYLKGRGISPSSYIDARVPGRTYYK